VVFERPDGAFGGVAAVDVRRRELYFDVIVRHVGDVGGGCFVVQPLEFWLEPTVHKYLVHALVGCEYVGAGARFERLGMDEV
jgi:hypothetical protein